MFEDLLLENFCRRDLARWIEPEESGRGKWKTQNPKLARANAGVEKRNREIMNRNFLAFRPREVEGER